MASAAEQLNEEPGVQLRLAGFPTVDIHGICGAFALPLLDEPLAEFEDRILMLKVRNVADRKDYKTLQSEARVSVLKHFVRPREAAWVQGLPETIEGLPVDPDKPVDAVELLCGIAEFLNLSADDLVDAYLAARG